MVSTVVLISIFVLLAGYLFYGRLLARKLKLDNSRPTPAVSMNDGVDYVPAKTSLLLAQHFSVIAAAGPIVGPILAGLWFGWAPVILWILIGGIFIGAVHDFQSLIASVRHKGTSIGELVKQYVSPSSRVLFMIFVWFALVYVIIAFTDITAQTFRSVTANSTSGPAVAVSSLLYLILGLLMGVFLYKLKMKVWAATLIFLPLVVVIIFLSTKLPLDCIQYITSIPLKSFEIILLVYCFIAAVIPVWLLLQPRGYLGGWFLYLTIIIALAGAIFGNFEIKYPAFHMEGLKSLVNQKMLFPILFITVACGACSGFHGIVSSGTTSKQICRETDTFHVGYGMMLLESLVAVLALVTVMIFSKNDAALCADPNIIYANGLANYLGMVGINFNLALTFALLAFSTFVYDTLDVCTRLARYILQELFNWKSRIGSFVATFITLLLPFTFLMLSKEKAYLDAWPIFGTSNQLLASLTLLVVSVWLFKTGRNPIYTILPMLFMMVVTMWSLVLQILPFIKSIPLFLSGIIIKPIVMISGVCGSILFILALWLLIEVIKVFKLKKTE